MTADGGESHLAARAARGDQDAYRVLLAELMPRILATVRGCGVPDTDVEDVAQEASIAIWKNLANFDPSRPFAPWAVVVAVNKARDWLRRRRVRNFWLGAEPLSERIISDQASVEEIVANRLEIQRVQDAIAALPRKLGVPLILTTIVGLSQSESAAALGISTKAIELRIARARARLKDVLD